MKRHIILMSVSVFAFLTACQRDRTVEAPAPGPDKNSETEVTLTVRTPSIYASETATVDENLIKSAYILAFRADDNTPDGDEPYVYSSLAYSITDGAESRYKTLGVTLLVKDYKQKFVIITNAKTAVEDLGLTEGSMTRKQVLEALQYGRTSHWHSAMGDGFVPLPMWGETDVKIIDDAIRHLGSVVLTRMVSRIDVVKADAVDDDTFTITSLHLYNHLTNGRVAPSRESTHWSDSDWKAIYPSLPSSDYHTVKGPLDVYAVNDGTTTTVPVLYAFETEAPAINEASKATCLVIGGKYNKASSPSYYRVDFVDKDDSGNPTAYKHLLRNHIYRVNISDVYGSGHPTPDEAFDSRAVNMNAEVKEWDEGDISHVVFDKDYMLGVSQTEYSLPRNKTTGNELIVTTDVPAGWEISCNVDWLQITSGQFSAPGGKDEVLFTVDENNTGARRTALITVKAAHLSIVVKVVQDIYDKNTLALTDGSGQDIDNLLFTSYGNQLKTLPLTAKAVWTPGTDALMVSYYVTGTQGPSFVQRLNPFLETVLYGGEKQYNVQPDEITAAELTSGPFHEKEARVNLVVGEGADALVKTLKLRQVHYNMVTDEADEYPLDGGTHYFTLSTNASWQLTIDSNPSLATFPKTSGDPVPDGERFYFVMKDDPNGNIEDRSMTVTFRYTGEDGRSGTHTVVIQGESAGNLKDAGDANSYILEPGGAGVAIPLSWANGSEYGQRIGVNDDVKLRVVWMESNRGIADNSIISSYTLKGNGSAGTIEVYPGTQEGNAIIAAYVGGEVKWSWHIWVTSYDIEGTAWSTGYATYMDINLGATNNTKNSSSAMGLLYQYGRKDPMPRLASLTSATQRQVWDEDKNSVTIQTAVPDVADNIRVALSNPTVFYTGVSGINNDWTSDKATNYTQRFDLWYKNGKSHYDPCPAGWMVTKHREGDEKPFSEIVDSAVNDSTNKGIYMSSGGQWWQNSGLINHSGTYALGPWGTYIMGYYWAAVTSSQMQYCYVLNPQEYNIQNSSPLERANAASIRCVRE